MPLSTTVLLILVNSTGSVFLGDGTDYLKGFGDGSFDGGNGTDTLDLKQGYYTIRISER
jgi:hypothetical protein